MRLCQRLSEYFPNATFTAFSQHPINLQSIPGNWRNQSGVYTSLPPVLWSKWVLGSLCKQAKIDIFWSPYSFLPSLPRQIPSLLTVFDFTDQVSPSTFSPMHLAAHRIFAPGDARRATTLLTISEGTKQRIQARFGRTATVIPPAVDEIFAPASSDSIEKILARHGIRQPYFLNVATWEPRKNVANLIRAFLSLKRQSKLPDHTLVLIGKRGRSCKDIEELANANAKHVKVLGYIPREELPALYSATDAFVFPSLYEGFGMPVAEALACGARVLTTDAPELRQTGGEACLYIAPTESAIESGLISICQQPKPSLNQIPHFSWDESTAHFAKKIQELLPHRR